MKVSGLSKTGNSGNINNLVEFLGVKHKLSSNNKNNTMTKRFLNNYSFAKEDTIDGAYIIPSSKVKISDVIQPNSIKDDFTNLIDEFKNKELLKNFGLTPNNKIIFNGPSGCGKTLSAMAIANSLKKSLYIINLSSIISSSLGKTSNNIFDLVEKCSNNNGIIFFDEFDALAKIRNDDKDHGELKRIASSIIQILDFINDDLIFIAATNHIELIDKAIIRRFTKKINFEMPSKVYIKKLIVKLTSELNLEIDKDTVKVLSEKYINDSYAEIKEDYISKIKKYIITETKKGKFNMKLNNDILEY